MLLFTVDRRGRVSRYFLLEICNHHGCSATKMEDRCVPRTGPWRRAWRFAEFIHQTGKRGVGPILLNRIRSPPRIVPGRHAGFLDGGFLPAVCRGTRFYAGAAVGNGLALGIIRLFTGGGCRQYVAGGNGSASAG